MGDHFVDLLFMINYIKRPVHVDGYNNGPLGRTLLVKARGDGVADLLEGCDGAVLLLVAVLMRILR